MTYEYFVDSEFLKVKCVYNRLALLSGGHFVSVALVKH